MSSAPPNLLPEPAKALLWEHAFSPLESQRLFDRLKVEIHWKHLPIRLFGKEILQPRLTASFADPDVQYGYSGVMLESTPWPEVLLEIKHRVEKLSGLRFNTALANCYRNGTDYMGWHRDNEKHLGPNPPVASVSFGATRTFEFRRYKQREKISLPLLSGSLLLMSGTLQAEWEHRLPRSVSVNETRVNITFRKVIK